MFNSLTIKTESDRELLERLKSDLLELFQAELNFVDKGGYGRSVRTPSVPTLVFQDSPSCACYPIHDHKDSCMLMHFVPTQFRGEALPCHHIPLNQAGETVASLESTGDQQALENAVKNWLKEKIAELQREAQETARHDSVAS